MAQSNIGLLSATATGNVNVNVISGFVERKANLNVRKLEANTPLTLAASKGRLEMVKLLLNNDVLIDAGNKMHKTALIKAVTNNHLQVVDWLLGWDASMYATTYEKEKH